MNTFNLNVVLILPLQLQSCGQMYFYLEQQIETEKALVTTQSITNDVG